MSIIWLILNENLGAKTQQLLSELPCPLSTGSELFLLSSVLALHRNLYVLAIPVLVLLFFI